MKIILSRNDVKAIILYWAQQTLPTIKVNTVNGLDSYSRYNDVELLWEEPEQTEQTELPL